MGLRVRNSVVLLVLTVVVLALTAGFTNVALADTPVPGSSLVPVLPTVFNQSMSAGAAIPTNARELPDKRTEYSTTYLLQNGSHTTVFSLTPVHFKDANGDWQPIDPTLTETGDGSYVTTRTPVKVTLANQAAGVVPVTIDSGAGPVSLSLLGALEDGALVSGASVLYPTVTTATDVSYEATGDGVKETITLASAAAPSSFAFKLTHAGFTLGQDDTGQWALFKPGAAKPSYLIGALSVYDSSVDEGGMPAYCDAARMLVKPGVGASTITYVIPRAWLSDPARVWPVTIDPGVFTQNPTDTYISAGYPNSSFGTSEDLLCGKVSTQTGDCKTLVKFPGIDYDAGGIPNGAHISAATCSIRQYWQPASHSDTVNIGRVSNGSSNWGEGSVWNGTLIDPVSMSSQTTTAMQQWVDIPCAGVVQGWERDDWANKGFVLYESSGAGSAWARKFRSGNYSDVTYRPKLSVTYDTPAMDDTLPAAASSSYAIGDTVSVQVTVSSITDASQITEIRMGTNRTATDASRRRGVLAWFASPPTDDNHWVYQKAAANGGYFAYFASTAYGGDHITPLLADCTIDSTHAVATFAYKVNANWGDVGNTSEWDTCLDMSAGSNTWTSGWVTQTAKTFTVDTTSGNVEPLESLTSTTTATNWFTGSGNDDSPTQGRGTVSLSWPAVDLASGYYIYLFDGAKFDYVATTTATSWSTAGKALYPTDTDLAAIPQGYAGNPFTAYGTTELRDNPNALYKKIAGSSAQDTDYRFRVVPYNATDGAADSNECAVLRVTLDNRSVVDQAREDPQHTIYDFGSWDGHDISGELDTGTLTADITDLSVASYGPAAELTRSYRSDRTTAGLFAPGWFFSFEQNLQIAPGQMVYTDAEHLTHAFLGSGSNWTAPNGYVATLAPDGANWRLAFTDQSYLTFDSAGKLLSETDHNGNATTYTWTAGTVTQITAANLQQITLTYTAGKLSSASYATAAGTRTVNYATAAPWQVTVYPGATGIQRKLTYAYDANSLLSSITQQDWPASGQSVAESFVYTSGKLTDVRFADWNATTNPSAHATVSYQTNQATIDHYGTVNGTANQVIDREVDTWDATTHLCATCTTGTTQPLTLTETYNYAFDRQLAMTTGSDGSQTSDTINLAHDQTSEITTSNSADSANQVTTYAFDSAHRVTVEQDYQSPAVCATISNTYNANGDLTEAKTLDRDGVTVLADAQYGYDSCGRQTMDKELVTGTPANGTWTETDYSNFAASGAPQTTVAKAVQLSYGGPATDLTKTATYDVFGNLLTVTDWSNSRVVATNTCDIAGNELTTTDAYGIVEHTTYDCMGNASESWQTATGTQMKAHWSATTFDACGRTLAVTTKRSDASGTATTQSVVTTTYDGNGDALTTHDTSLGGQDEKTLYNTNGNAIQTWAGGVFDTTTAARSTRSVYDSLGNVTYESAPGNANAPGAGQTCTATTYDTAGNVLSTKQPDGTLTQSTYDGQANQKGTSGGSDTLWTTSTTTDVAGRQTVAVAAPESHVGLKTTITVDQLGRATSVTAQRDGQPSPATQTTYNAFGWVLQVGDANGVTTSTTYDTHACVTSETIGTKTTVSTYDADNRLHTQTDAAGNVVTYTYDLFGNTTEAKHQTSGGTVLKDVTTVVDSLGRPTSQSESISHVTHTWSHPQNTASGVQETIAYDATPLTSTAINRNARNVETSQVTTIKTNSTVTRSIADSTSGRDTADRWISASIQKSGSSAITESRSFDSAGRYASQSGAGFSSAGTYSYDADTGKKAADSLPLLFGGAIADSFTYFAGGSLASATTNGVADAFAYDEVGNLVRDSVTSGATTSFTYDVQNRLTQTSVVAADGTTSATVYGWDQTNDWRTTQGPSGNPSQITYAYTALGRLASYHNGGSPVTDATYTYDAAGQRTKSAVTVGSTTTTTSFAYDGITLLSLGATQGSTSWRVDYLYDEEGTPYGAVYRSPSTSTSPTYFTMITNDHGDVLELLDASGNAFAAYRYDAWGLPQGAGNYATGVWTQSTTLITATLAGQIASRQVLRYASYAYDPESGLYYLSARCYDPATRQFTTADSAKANGEQSAYQYCGGEPVGNDDPSGKTMHSARVNRPGHPGEHAHAALYYTDVANSDGSIQLTGRCYLGVMFFNHSKISGFFAIRIQDNEGDGYILLKNLNSGIDNVKAGGYKWVGWEKSGCFPDTRIMALGFNWHSGWVYF